MKKIKLFDYQEDMKSRIEKALGLHRSVMVQMPTGTGKTILLASVVESFLREHSNCNVWIVAHRRELVSQIKDTLNKFLLNFIFSNHPVPPSKVFTKLFEEAEIAKFTPTELKEYEDSLKAYRDVKNSIDTALEKGREEKAIQIAKKMLAAGMDIDTIINMTDLSKDEIEKL